MLSASVPERKFFSESSEEGNEPRLGLFPGREKKIAISSNIKVPHRNKIVLNENHPMAHLFDGIDLANKKFYFSHSYRFPDSEHALAYVDYGVRFPVVVAKDNLIAIQFHPEKSYGQGLQLLKECLRVIMITSRKIPVLQILDGKTRKFKSPVYIGNPLNAVKIFNDKEVDELIILDISPERRERGPNFKLVEDLLSECQMPVGYGGGIRNLDQAHDIFHLGAEKIVVNSLAYNNPKELRRISDTYGTQAVSFSVDYDISLFGNFRFFKHSDTSKMRYSLNEITNLIRDISYGEVILHNISSDSSFKVFDCKLLIF